jgi:WD40 repeat protein
LHIFYFSFFADLEQIVRQFAEHTKAVTAVRWNDNNADQFASVSEDGLVKIWDRRTDESVSTLFDREDMQALCACDWHKADVRCLPLLSSPRRQCHV